jgi:hypothetical protein
MAKNLILGVAFDDENNIYSVDIPAGSCIPETAFAMSVVIRCLIKDGIIEKSTDVTDLINKYIDDPQYEEVKENDEV